MKIENIDIKSVIALIAAIGVLAGFYYTTQHRLDHLEEKMTQSQQKVRALDSKVNNLEKFNKRNKKKQ